ncbi:MAG: UDP-N-acetylmuramate:L-alanyl-gamma-D-glutamyl-meso-diaminopimelate ligase [Deltaproteobacteria bacterium]|nr:UDP-N-acetylmuramate:L-alanyl-gamma-D-glutamyl-meso-diaminopimelate ligase [Deltaproteobacteria bacterium]
MSLKTNSQSGFTRHHYHFSAICGTGMASLAVLLKNRGHKVTGSDENMYPPMSDFLQENQIDVSTPYHAENLQPHPDFVVLGNALSRGNPEVEYALQAHLHYFSMAELLKNEFIRGNCSVVISGTHGKTTCTSLAAHIMTCAGKPTGFMVGGIPENFGTSSRDVEAGGYFVIEGDEYDTSLFDKRSKFFHYLPDRLIINNIEFDHADIFNDIEEIKRAFSLMLRQIPRDGLIIVNGDDENAMAVAKTGFTPFITFGTGSTCDAVIRNIATLADTPDQTFELVFKNQIYPLRIPLLGEYNVRNSVAVVLLALHEGIKIETIQEALLSFKNVRRRLQLLTKNDQVRVFDDFAPHPTAIVETLKAVRAAWPDAGIHAIYEARSNTSVRQFHQSRMAECFAAADSVTFYKLFRGERINDAERLDLKRIVAELNENGKPAWVVEELDLIVEACLNRAKSGDIFLVMSNGAFGSIQHKLAGKLDQRWQNRNH